MWLSKPERHFLYSYKYRGSHLNCRLRPLEHSGHCSCYISFLIYLFYFILPLTSNLINLLFLSLSKVFCSNVDTTFTKRPLQINLQDSQFFRFILPFIFSTKVFQAISWFIGIISPWSGSAFFVMGNSSCLHAQ